MHNLREEYLSSLDALTLERLSSSPWKGNVTSIIVTFWFSGEIMTKSGLFFSGLPGTSFSTNLLPGESGMVLIKISLCLCLIRPIPGRAMVQSMAKGLRYAVTGPAGGGGTAGCIDTLLDSSYLEKVEAGFVGKTILREGDIVA